MHRVGTSFLNLLQRKSSSVVRVAVDLASSPEGERWGEEEKDRERRRKTGRDQGGWDKVSKSRDQRAHFTPSLVKECDFSDLTTYQVLIPNRSESSFCYKEVFHRFA